MSDDTTDDRLERWTATLAAELGIAESAIDVEGILALAGTVAHAIVRPAAPLSTYLVGYAAGRAAALDEPQSFASLSAAVSSLAARGNGAE